MDVLLGLQWGDEGKGKVVDHLAAKYDVIARFQGGPNAGHTLIFNNKKYVLHQIPSGVFHPHMENIIGNGVVINPSILREEIKNLAKYGLHIEERFYISKKAHLIIPTHCFLDMAYEQHKKKNKIGSTLRGISPVYEGKVGRIGLRVGDILSDNFRKKYNTIKEHHLEILTYYDYKLENLSHLEKNFFKSIEYMKTLQLVDSEYFLNEKIKQGKKILAEGAQGSLLDIDFGSYPFVTSSNTLAGGASIGLGVPPRKIEQIFGVFKAYCTRVGNGPFPTILTDEIGEKLQKEGNEYGSTTRRERSCGWLDLPALKYAIMLNGITELFMTKVDVLNHFENIQICIQYSLQDNTLTDRMPFDLANSHITPIYKTFRGWKSGLENIKFFKDFPKELSDYIHFIEKQTGIPIMMISVGSRREQTIFRY